MDDKELISILETVYTPTKDEEHYIRIYQIPHFEQRDHKAYFLDLLDISWHNALVQNGRSIDKKQICKKLWLWRNAFNRFYSYCIDNDIYAEFKSSVFINPKYVLKGKKKPYLNHIFYNK